MKSLLSIMEDYLSDNTDISLSAIKTMSIGKQIATNRFWGICCSIDDIRRVVNKYDLRHQFEPIKTVIPRAKFLGKTIYQRKVSDERRIAIEDNGQEFVMYKYDSVYKYETREVFYQGKIIFEFTLIEDEFNRHISIYSVKRTSLSLQALI